MGFLWLLFQMLFLMLVSAVGGYFLRKWIERSQYKDVTLSYSKALASQGAAKREIDNLNTQYLSLQNKVDSKLEGVLGRFAPIEDKLSSVDMSAKLANVEQKIADVQTQISSLPKAKDTDLSPVLGAISEIRIPQAQAPNFEPVMDAISSIRIPEQKETNLSPVLSAIEQIHVPEPEKTNLTPVLEAIRKIRIPEAKEVDIAPLMQAIKQIQIPQQKETDLKPVLDAIYGIRIPEKKELNTLPLMSAIRNIKIPENKPTDVKPVMDAIKKIKVPEQKQTDLSPVLSAIRNIKLPVAKEPNLSPVLAEIKSLKAELKKRPVEKKVVKTVVKKVPSQENKAVISNRLGDRGNRLRKAAFGKPDDLKVISGVGPKLEKMLHGIGVYYYWQVADWTKTDVQEADDLLDAFKGRIQRDGWVSQAKKLAKLSTAAKRP